MARTPQSQAQETGKQGESLAVDLALGRGWQQPLCNVRLGPNEADLIAFRQEAVGTAGLLLEVKSSRSASAVLAARLSQRQMARLWQMAEFIAEKHQLQRVEVVLLTVVLGGGYAQSTWTELEPF